MNRANAKELASQSRLHQSKAAHELFCYDDTGADENTWYDDISSSGAVSFAGQAWERSLHRLLQCESESVIRVWVMGGRAVQYLSHWGFEQSWRAQQSWHAQNAVALLDEWLNDDSGYDEETWPELKKSLDRDRLSDRKLFDG